MDYPDFLHKVHDILGSHKIPINVDALKLSVQSFIDGLTAAGDVVPITDDLKIIAVEVETPTPVSAQLSWVLDWLTPSPYKPLKDATPLFRVEQLEFYLVRSDLGYFVLMLDGENTTLCAIEGCAVHENVLFQRAAAACKALGLKTVI